MILYPAIDLKDQKVVRLIQGDYNQVTVYSDDPVSMAKKWADEGAQWLHLVDLDAAKTGQPAHQKVIEKIAHEVQVKIQIGGGVRSLETAQEYLNSGVSRVVVGTKAVSDRNFLEELGKKCSGKIALGLDTKQGKIAVSGWLESTDQSIEDFLSKAPLSGIGPLIFTDIARDGMLKGPNLEALLQVLNATTLEVIASGGVSSLEDIQKLKELKHPRLDGVIIGKALYEGKFTLKEALDVN